MSAVLLRDASPEALDAYARQLAREDLAFLIERALALLDALDGDADLEPSLGSPDFVFPGYLERDRDHSTSQLAWAAGSADDREDDVDSHEGEGRLEPTIRSRQLRRPGQGQDGCELRRAA